MNENKPGGPYQPYGYGQYDVQVSTPQAEGLSGVTRGSGIKREQKGLFGIMSKRKMRVSVLAAGALLLAVGGFSVLIANSYPDRGDNANVPIVRADKVAFKEMPSEPGGMNIANSDSTIYETFKAEGADREVENLLRKSGQPMDKLEAFAQQVEEKLKEQEMEKAVRMSALEDEQAELLQKISPASGGNDASVKPATKPKTFHKAGESPETIDFIRSVLKDKAAGKDGTASAAPVSKTMAKADVAAQVSAIEPAAGAAVSAGTYTSGLYFVQLASIGDRTRAPSEWSKIQKSFTGGVLQDVNYRVSKADLGDKGVFYRIQAGPFSKADAQMLCEKVKAQKPGGCFVLK